MRVKNDITAIQFDYRYEIEWKNLYDRQTKKAVAANVIEETLYNFK